MQAAIISYLFIFGLFVGSFLNLISDRLPQGKKIVFGRSKCDHCGKELKAKNLIPVLSFIFQKGECEYCHKKLSFFYPISEIFTGLVFVLAGYLSGFIFEMSSMNLFSLFYYLVIMCVYVVMFLTDVKYYLILDSIVIPAIIFVILSALIFRFLSLAYLYRALANDSVLMYLLRTDFFTNRTLYVIKDFGFTILGALGISLFFLFLIAITKGKGMGFGDVKLGFFIGLANGFTFVDGFPLGRFPLGVIAIFLGFTLGAFFSLFLILLKRKTMKDTVPFGPFLILGSLITFVAGPAIWNFYTQLSLVSTAPGM